MTSEEPQDPEEESQAESSAAEPAAPTQEEQDKATRIRMLIGIVGTILVLVVVFWFIFTFIIDPEVVVDAILSLDLWQLGVLALMAVVAYVLFGFSFRNTLSNLGIKDATLGMLASLAVKGSIPGPMDTVFRFRLAVAYGLVLYWQKRDHFSLLSADSAQYAGKGDPAHDEVTP